MRVCRACQNWIHNRTDPKRVEPLWLSIHGLCPKCQITKGALQFAKKREEYARKIAQEK